ASSTLISQSQGNVVIDGGAFTNTGQGWQLINSNSGPTLRLAITNGGAFTMSGLTTGSLRGGANGEDATSPYILGVSGQLTVSAHNNLNVTNANIYLGNSGGKATAYFRSGGVVTTGGILPGGTAVSELDLDGGTIIPAFSATNFIQGLSNAFVQAGGVT